MVWPIVPMVTRNKTTFSQGSLLLGEELQANVGCSERVSLLQGRAPH